ncbi:MAG: hypothetical protein JWO48_1210 [Bryobacterales bacterium]|nr:hypothetical protein [Bryobacterales bacterium]
MSDIYECRECGKEIARNARTCPHCGHRGTSVLSIILAVVIGIVGLIVIISSQQPTSTGAVTATAAPDPAARKEALKKLRPAVRSACEDHPWWDIETCQTINRRQVHVGMTPEQARLGWGKPEKINVTSFGRVQHEQWVYSMSSYLYFDNDALTSIQTSK